MKPSGYVVVAVVCMALVGFAGAPAQANGSFGFSYYGGPYVYNDPYWGYYYNPGYYGHGGFGIFFETPRFHHHDHHFRRHHGYHFHHRDGRHFRNFGGHRDGFHGRRHGHR
jgi:hypothetical protein